MNPVKTQKTIKEPSTFERSIRFQPYSYRQKERGLLSGMNPVKTQKIYRNSSVVEYLLHAQSFIDYRKASGF